MDSFGIIAFTRTGCELAKRLGAKLAEQPAYAGASSSVAGPVRFAGEMGIDAYESLASWTAEHFGADDALVYVGASGIAVRAIAAHVSDKFSDPAVVSVDEAGRFAVPLLSGHVGGANDLARAVARISGGQAAVSTATDVNELFAVDEWAARHGFAIVERAVAKEISAALLEGKPVYYASDFELEEKPVGITDVSSDLLGGQVASRDQKGAALAGGALDAPGATDAQDASGAPGSEGAAAPKRASLGFVVSLDESSSPFARTLHLVPRVATLGIGCRRGTDPVVLERVVGDVLACAHISPRAIAAIASIDVKADERAILELASKWDVPCAFYTADELAAVPGDFASSDFVRRTVGVDNVCERAACANGGALIVGKQAGEGVTVAVAMGKVGK